MRDKENFGMRLQMQDKSSLEDLRVSLINRERNQNTPSWGNSYKYEENEDLRPMLDWKKQIQGKGQCFKGEPL